jgi:hypothetical protein
MRKLTHPLLAIALCAAALTTHAQPAQAPLSVVTAYMKAWSALPERRGITDMDISMVANAAARYLDANVKFLDTTVGTPQVGIVVARDNVIKPFLTSYPNARWEMVRPAKVTGHTVEFDWRFTGNAYGPYILDATCSGKGDRLELVGHSVIVVKDGLITQQTDSYDDQTIPTQMRRTASACTEQKAAAPK